MNSGIKLMSVGMAGAIALVAGLAVTGNLPPSIFCPLGCDQSAEAATLSDSSSEHDCGKAKALNIADAEGHDCAKKANADGEGHDCAKKANADGEGHDCAKDCAKKTDGEGHDCAKDCEHHKADGKGHDCSKDCEHHKASASDKGDAKDKAADSGKAGATDAKDEGACPHAKQAASEKAI